MSDFLVNVLNRHTGISKQVRPRVRTRFEPDVSVNSLPQYAMEKIEAATNNCNDGQESPYYTTTTIVSPADEPPTNTMDDNSFKKYQLHDKHELVAKSGKVNGLEVASRTQQGSHLQSASQQVSGVYMDTDKNTGKRRGITGNHVTPSRRQKSVRDHKNVSEDASATYEYDMGKDMHGKVQKTLTRLISPGEHHHLIKSTKADNLIYKAMNPNHRDSHNLQSNQCKPTKSEIPLALSGNLMKARLGKAESQAETELVTNVTIGRIEVRAVPQEIEQSRREKKPSGVMSLDEYLRRRTTGGNR